MNYPTGYEVVNRGDVIEKNWLFYSESKGWIPSIYIGKIVDPCMIAEYCRPIEQPNKENAMLVLELKIVDRSELPNFARSSDVVLFKIIRQEGFAWGKEYKASNGINIESVDCPDYSGSNKFFLRGEIKDKDDTIIAVTKEQFSKIQAAVKEILERENKPKFLETITFFHNITKKRYKVNVISNDGTNIVSVDCDTKEKSSVYVGNLRDIQTLPNAF